VEARRCGLAPALDSGDFAERGDCVDVEGGLFGGRECCVFWGCCCRRSVHGG
jgi:hypothetical protein